MLKKFLRVKKSLASLANSVSFGSLTNFGKFVDVANLLRIWQVLASSASLAN